MRTALAALLLFAAAPLQPLDETGFRALLQRHRGRIVLVDFWATWCEPCRTEMPALVALERKWRGRGLVLITVSADDPEQEADARAFLEKTRVPTPAYIKRAKSDEDFINAIDPKWSGALPALYLYGRSGEKVTGFIGETETADIEAAIAKAAR